MTSSNMADVAMGEPELLATRRSKRSTAGNRMAAALAEMALDETARELDDDNDFTELKDEEDVFESDFESTEEEGPEGDTITGEQAVEMEERKARKAARSRLEKITAAAHAKNKMTFNPQDVVESKPKVKSKRRVSLGAVVNAETGEIIGVNKSSSSPRKQRHSERKHTIQNTSATVSRLKQSEQKKAAAPKKNKITTRTFAQMELIAKALDNEEGNIVEHRDYLKLEEEKRRRAHVVRAAVEGPLLRWVSKAETVVVKPPSLPPPPGHLSQQTFQSISQPTTDMGPPNNPDHLKPEVSQPLQAAVQVNPLQPTPQSEPQHKMTHNINGNVSLNEQSELQSIEPTVPEETTKETITRNYLVHEFGQFDGIPMPRWVDTMEAMFGDHVQWDELKVYTGKGRPWTRPKQICPITGKEALYFDPRTGVPFADVRAYEVLGQILRHEYIWSPSLGCYIGRDEKP